MASKWEPPRQLLGKAATRAQRRTYPRLVEDLQTCDICKTVYVDQRTRAACEAWHREVWKQMRADLGDAIDRLKRKVEAVHAQANTLTAPKGATKAQLSDVARKLKAARKTVQGLEDEIRRHRRRRDKLPK